MKKYILPMLVAFLCGVVFADDVEDFGRYAGDSTIFWGTRTTLGGISQLVGGIQDDSGDIVEDAVFEDGEFVDGNVYADGENFNDWLESTFVGGTADPCYYYQVCVGTKLK